MSIKAVVIHRRDANNIGDMASDPLQYFLKDSEYEKVDITQIGRHPFPDDIPVIYGGGGLLANEFFGEAIDMVFDRPDVSQLNEMWDHRWRLCNPKYKELYAEFNKRLKEDVVNIIKQIEENKKVKRVIWGAGHNQRDYNPANSHNIKYPRRMKDFDLIGVRDYWDDLFQAQHPEWDWVPCASCMHPAFDKKYPVKNDIIVFEHKKQLIKGNDFGPTPVPRFINSGSNMEQTIELLGSANTILTNSYHGAYWGTLLGKKVIVLGPWSSKFYSLKHKPYLLGKPAGWLDALDEAPIYPNALEEARNATKDFWTRVKAVL
jgi:hypothetical protein